MQSNVHIFVAAEFEIIFCNLIIDKNEHSQTINNVCILICNNSHKTNDGKLIYNY